MFQMKMDLPSFNGQLQIEGFLDWLVLVERFFDCMDIPEDKKVKLVIYRLLGELLPSGSNYKVSSCDKGRGWHNKLQHWAIQGRVAMQTIYTLSETVALAIKAEAQLDRSKAMVRAKNPFDNNREIVNKGKTLMTPLTSTIQPSFSNTTWETSSRYCSNQCPRRSIMNLIELEEECIFDIEKDDNEAAYTYEKEEVIEGDEGELLSQSLIVQRVLLALK
ncbi:hypothetical protein POTOM_029027 [Populus tomentosa]|uniref:Uncharacterized protein n=1 Tax=Populus tomentosa TaxID=118781 RepID=A0A8X7Z661_POPTO|nr:hypothetical protein POTOM_029027 [Populus tomentosa]